MVEPINYSELVHKQTHKELGRGKFVIPSKMEEIFMWQYICGVLLTKYFVLIITINSWCFIASSHIFIRYLIESL